MTYVIRTFCRLYDLSISFFVSYSADLLSYAHPPALFYPDRKVQTIKDLEKPWAALTPRLLRPASHTLVDPKLKHSAATTLLLDDSHAKAALQPYNHLCVPEYTRALRNADLAVLLLERATRQQQQQKQLQHSSVSYREAPPDTPDATTNTDAHERAVSSPDGSSTTAESDIHKRKRKKKKKDKKQAQQLPAVIEADGAGASPAVFDETLLAVIGILHAARLQYSIAGWLRAGALLSPPPLSDSERAGAVGDDAKTRTWCDDPVLVRAWASLGREAMGELGLKVEHGIES